MNADQSQYDRILSFVRKNSIERDALTEAQIVEVIRQIIASGDVTVFEHPDGTRRVGYLPGSGMEQLIARHDKLLKRMKAIREALES